jgi:hypothetical protein
MDKLKQEGRVGENITVLIIRIMLYVDDVILTDRTLCTLQDLLWPLGTFCMEVGMNVKTDKTKQVVFSLKRKSKQTEISFRG